MTHPIAPGAPTAVQAQQAAPWAPPPIKSIEDTGLNLITIAELALKVLYFGGVVTGSHIAELIKLPYNNVVDTALEFLKKEKYMETKGQSGLTDAAFQYVITGKGTEKAREILDQIGRAHV